MFLDNEPIRNPKSQIPNRIMSFENIEWIWKNGEIIPWAEATVHVSAHGLHYGSGVFEGIRCYETSNGAAFFRVREHYERFHASADVYGF